MKEPVFIEPWLVIGICAFTGAALAPFSIHHLLQGEWFSAASTGALNLVLLASAVGLYWQRSRRRLIQGAGQVLLLLANVTVALNVYAEGGPTVFWMYPMIFANFYMLPLVRGIALSIVSSAICLWLVAPTLPPEYLARIAAVVPLCILFGMVFSHSVSAQRRQLHYLANHDSLTGLGNRLSMETGLTDALARKHRYGERCSMLMFDVDKFKEINDSLGHNHADGILAELATLMHDRIRVMDRLFRFGGEEFVLLVPHAGERASWQLAEALRLEVEDHVFRNGTRVTVSIGVAELEDDEDAESWFRRADAALLKAKKSGRNCVISETRPPSKAQTGGPGFRSPAGDFRSGGPGLDPGLRDPQAFTPVRAPN